MGKLKKGIFYTIGFFLLSGIILSLAILTFKNFNFSQERFNEVIILDRIYELDKSIEEGFRDIINIKSGLIASKVGTNVKFIEPLPNSNKNDLINSLDEYKLFLENNFSVLANVSSLKTTLPLTIKPHEIKYYHENFGDNIIKVEAENPNFDGYTLLITTTEELTATSCAASGSQQDVYMEVYATGSTGSCSSASHAKNIVTLFNSLNQVITTISVDGADLTITSPMQINITTTIDNLEDLGTASVTLPKEVLYHNYTEFGISKNSTFVLV